MIKFNAGDETAGAIYGPAMEIQTAEEAAQYLKELVTYHAQKWNLSLEQAEINVRGNLGYYAGYYNAETFDRVMKLFGAAHPIFGTQYPIIK